MNLTPEEIRALIAYHSAKLVNTPLRDPGYTTGSSDGFSTRFAKDVAERILQLSKELP